MSSVIYGGVGQCGVQIMKELIELETFNEKNYFLDNFEKLNSIFIDTEPKVIKNIQKDGKSKLNNLMREENFIYGNCGRGSNWCYGYYGNLKENSLNDKFLNTFRKNLERSDNHLGCLLVHSIGGGTGAGLGCKLTETVKDEFDLHQIINCIVAPSDFSGDSPLQYYNSILSLSHLYKVSDGLVLFHNDALSNQLGLNIPSAYKLPAINLNTTISSNPISSQNTHFGLADVNHLIANQISAFFSPCSSIYPWEHDDIHLNIEINEFIRSLCSLNQLKIIQIASSMWTNKKPPDWIKLTNQCMDQLNIGYGRIDRTISSIVCYRGANKEDSYLNSIKSLERNIKKRLNFVSGCHANIDIWIDELKSGVRCSNVSLSTAFNSGSIRNYLNHLIRQGRLKFNSKAYLHWYYRHGGSEELFEEAFIDMDKIIENYDI